MEKELLFEGKENTSSVNIKEFSPKGAMLDITLAGKISGKISGIIMTTHNMLIKPDGTGEADLQGQSSLATASQSSSGEKLWENW